MYDSNNFEAIYTEIDLFWHNSLLKSEDTCRDYEKLDYNYEQCFSKNLIDFLIQELGCLPPWFKNAKVINTLIEMIILKSVLVFLATLSYNFFIPWFNTVGARKYAAFLRRECVGVAHCASSKTTTNTVRCVTFPFEANKMVKNLLCGLIEWMLVGELLWEWYPIEVEGFSH